MAETTICWDDITLVDILAVTHIQHAQGTQITIPHRSGMAFSLKKSGKTVYNQNGKRIISDAAHIVYLPRGASYVLKVEEPGECILFEVAFEGEQPFREITAFPVGVSGELYHAAEKAERAWTYRKQGYRHACLSCLYNILAGIHPDTDVYINSAKLKIIEPSIRYMEEHLSDPDICTEKLAVLSGISVPYFRKLFTEIYRMPVARYIESIRIRKAQELLKSDYTSVGDVAEYVGYRNIYHFSKVFKKVTGMSPSEFAIL